MISFEESSRALLERIVEYYTDCDLSEHSIEELEELDKIRKELFGKSDIVGNYY